MDKGIDEIERRLREDPADGEARRTLIESLRRQGERRRLFRLLCEAARRGDDAALIEAEAWNWRYSSGRLYPFRGPWSIETPAKLSPRGSIANLTSKVLVAAVGNRHSFFDPESYEELWAKKPQEDFVDLVGDDALLRSGHRFLLRDGRDGSLLAEAALDSELSELDHHGHMVFSDRLILRDEERGHVFDLGEAFGRRLYSIADPGSFHHSLRGHLLTLSEGEREDLLAVDARGEALRRLPDSGALIHGHRASCSTIVRGRLVERSYRGDGSELRSSLRLIEQDLSACRCLDLVPVGGQHVAYEDLIESEAFSSWTAIGDELIMTEQILGGPDLLMRLDAGAFAPRDPGDFQDGVITDSIALAPGSKGLLWIQEMEGIADLIRCEAGLIVYRALDGRDRIELLDIETGALLGCLYEARCEADTPGVLIPGPQGLFLERPPLETPAQRVLLRSGPEGVC